MLNKESYRYKAFISYRHCDGDRDWAKWTHRSLESMIIPKHIRIKYDHENNKLGRLFRDEEELPASSNLSDSISIALQESEFLIVICSPNLPRSKWCSAEISQFRSLGRQDNIIALLIDGEPEQAFPKELTSYTKLVTKENGEKIEEYVEVEPLAADVRPRKSETIGQLKYKAKMRLASVLLGCKYDELIQRDSQRRKKRALIYTAIASLVVLSLALLGWRQFKLAEEKLFQESLFITKNVNQAVKEQRYDLAKILFLESIPKNYRGEAIEYPPFEPVIEALKHDRLQGIFWTHKQKKSASSEYDVPSIFFTENGGLAIDSSNSNWWNSIEKNTQVGTPVDSIQFYDVNTFNPYLAPSKPIEKASWVSTSYILDFGKEERTPLSYTDSGFIVYNNSFRDLLIQKNDARYTWTSKPKIEGAWLIEFPLILIFDEEGIINLVNLETQEVNQIPHNFNSFKNLKFHPYKPVGTNKLLAIIQSEAELLSIEIDSSANKTPPSHFSLSSSDEIVDISVSRSGKLFAVLRENSRIEIYSVNDKKLQASIAFSQYFVDSMVFNARETLLAVSGIEYPILETNQIERESYFVTSIWNIAENKIAEDAKLSEFKAFSDVQYPLLADFMDYDYFDIVLMQNEALRKQLIEHLIDNLPPGRNCLVEREQYDYLSRSTIDIKERADWDTQRCLN